MLKKSFAWLNKLVLAALLITTLAPQALALEIGVAPVLTNVTATPNPYNPTNSSVNYGVVTMSWNLNTTSNIWVEVYDGVKGAGGTKIADPMGPTNRNPGADSINWDGKRNGVIVAKGTYYYYVSAINLYAATPVVAAGSFVVDYTNSPGTAPKITTLYVTPTTFDPTSEQARFVAVVDQVVDSLKTEVQVNGSYTRIDNVKYDVSQGTFYWDGVDQYGDQVSDGSYSYRVTASNSNGTDIQYGTVRVNSDDNDNNNHQDSIGTLINNVSVDNSNIDTDNNERAALRFDVRRDGVRITVDVIDSDDDVVRTLTTSTTYNTSTGNSMYWNGKNDNGSVVSDGTYTMRIRATKSGYSNEVAYRDVDVNGGGTTNNNFTDDFGSLISNVSVENDIFNPKQSERAKLLFDVEKSSVKITVDILTLNKSSIRNLVNGTTYSTSNGNSVYWNGRNTSNTIQKDAVYVYRVRATKSGYASEVGYRFVEVDTDGVIIGFPTTNNNGNCAGFTDVPSSNPYCKAIELMKLKGIFIGYSDGTFRPYTGISRSEVVKVVLLAIGLSVNTSDTRSSTYWDITSGSWYVPYLNAATRYGIIIGYRDGAFRPDRVPSKVELLKIFLRGTGINIPRCSVAPYNDTPTDAWYLDYVCFAVNNQLVYGDGTGKFNPDTPMNRGDVALLFYNFYVRGMDRQINYDLYGGYNSGYMPGSYAPATYTPGYYSY